MRGPIDDDYLCRLRSGWLFAGSIFLVIAVSFVVAVLGAAANATSSVLQRKANRDVPAERTLSPRLILDLLREPVWFFGILAVTVGFILQAVALATGALASIEPVFIIELPFTLLLGTRVFNARLHKREWLAVAGMTAGLAAMLALLAPSNGAQMEVPTATWLISGGTTVAFAVLLVLASRIGTSTRRRSALLGVAAGTGFGLTASLVKAMTNEIANGFTAIFTSWPLYAVIACGVGAFLILQSAFNAGPLVAAQPGVTLTDPIVSVAWGVGVYGEQVRTGWLLLGACLAAVLAAVSVLVLARSPLLASDADDGIDRSQLRERETDFGAAASA